ncbi:hypothetical protein RIF29_09976 [Crotalaria pallida]|uniref:TPX2 central domain-containing protein n=1 Tax=Crotalaria pallida TaxID=3830 RepID=A0AAN9FVH8_CROPI
MAAVAEETGGGRGGSDGITMIDETYEFAAPRFFDFINGETDEDKLKAELWFDTALFYVPSPFMPKIKTSRSITVDSLCDFSEADNMPKAPFSEVKEENNTTASHGPCSEAKEENNSTASHVVSADKERSDKDRKGDSECLSGVSSSGGATVEVGKDACTPNPTLQKRVASTNSKKQQTAKKIATNAKLQLRSSAMKSTAGTPNLIHENQAAKPKLTLTRPKEPEFETTQRARPARVKSAAELEEEMMAKMPKFKARPVNKKILQTPTLPPMARSTPQPPEFKEFHLETMARAHQNVDSASIASTELSSHKENPGKPRHLTEPKTPVLQTSPRARPAKVKSSLEIEQEELEKIPKLKARPLNKKIFESKGDIGIFCNTKKHVTEPQEFHFATSERIPPPAAMADLFDKLSLKSEPVRKPNPIPRITTPNPFHLHSEERGAEKERRLCIELLQKQLEEERARVPKANPYPYTTDYPVIPPKPEPKHCTKPSILILFSCACRDPIPFPEKVRKPLTQQGFNLHVEHRAVDRAQFDEKIKEKEMKYKRYREESEAERMVC